MLVGGPESKHVCRRVEEHRASAAPLSHAAHVTGFFINQRELFGKVIAPHGGRIVPSPEREKESYNQIKGGPGLSRAYRDSWQIMLATLTIQWQVLIALCLVTAFSSPVSLA